MSESLLGLTDVQKGKLVEVIIAFRALWNGTPQNDRQTGTHFMRILDEFEQSLKPEPPPPPPVVVSHPGSTGATGSTRGATGATGATGTQETQNITGTLTGTVTTTHPATGATGA
jgi:hypothetical protein